MRLGFPRALTYYDYYPFWAGFFYKLGIQLHTSPQTNRSIMELGLKKAPDETCLPVKILVGHLLAFQDVDGIFLPRLVSMEKNTYLCPKILGLPESVLYAVPKEIKVYTVDINWRRGKGQVLKSLYIFGEEIGCTKSQIREAFVEAQRWQKAYQRMRNGGWSFEESIECFEVLAEPTKLEKLGFVGNLPYSDIEQERQTRQKEIKEDKETSIDNYPSAIPKIALVGHSYLAYENYANLNLLRHLKEKAEVKVVENVPSGSIEEKHQELPKKIFWSHAKKIYGAGVNYVENPEIDGLIYLSCFGCGTDSMTNDMLARKAREYQKPYLVLTLDEHSGEAGLVTRIEAFLDMLERRKEHESNFSPYGKLLDRYSSLT